MYKLIQEDVVIKLRARVIGKGEGEYIGGGDTARHSGSNDGERGYRGGGYDSGEKGFRSSVTKIRFFLFLFLSFPSTVIARIFRAICHAIKTRVWPVRVSRPPCL